MKKIFKSLVVVMMAVMTLSLCACSDSKSLDDAVKAENAKGRHPVSNGLVFVSVAIEGNNIVYLYEMDATNPGNGSFEGYKSNPEQVKAGVLNGVKARYNTKTANQDIVDLAEKAGKNFVYRYKSVGGPAEDAFEITFTPAEVKEKPAAQQ